MPLNYTNRRQETYYVRAAGARKGGVRYYIVKDFTRYRPEEILEAMPTRRLYLAGAAAQDPRYGGLAHVQLQNSPLLKHHNSFIFSFVTS
jgi:hypothetical protein